MGVVKSFIHYRFFDENLVSNLQARGTLYNNTAYHEWSTVKQVKLNIQFEKLICGPLKKKPPQPTLHWQLVKYADPQQNPAL